MIYLIVKMLTFLLISALIGAVIGWYLRGSRDKELLAENERSSAARIADLRGERDAAEKRLAETEAALAACEAAAEASPVPASPAAAEPVALASAPVAAVEAPDEPEPEPAAAPEQAEEAPPEAPQPDDDLRMISGIGPKIAGQLKEMGITRFAQIAALTPDQAEEINERLRFKGRIEREDWIGQAKTLAAGGETEFSKKSKKS